ECAPAMPGKRGEVTGIAGEYPVVVVNAQPDREVVEVGRLAERARPGGGYRLGDVSFIGLASQLAEPVVALLSDLLEEGQHVLSSQTMQRSRVGDVVGQGVEFTKSCQAPAAWYPLQP